LSDGLIFHVHDRDTRVHGLPKAAAGSRAQELLPRLLAWFFHQPPDPPTIATISQIRRPSSLRSLENIGAGDLIAGSRRTTPNDRLHVIDVLERAAAILRDEMRGEQAA
jgi:hypothetical protein